MDQSARRELNDIKNELISIARELEDIARGVRNDFTGIGNERCANCLENAAGKYRSVKRKLDNIKD